MKAVIKGIRRLYSGLYIDKSGTIHNGRYTDEWIMTRIGVKERRILKEDGLGTSHMGTLAVENLLEKTGIS